MDGLKRVKWEWDYGVYVPFCPYCGEPAYEKRKCCFCGKPYLWVEGKHKPTVITVGKYVVMQATNNHISIYKNGSLAYHAACTVKKTEAELVQEVENMKKLLKILEDEEDG